MPRGRPRAFDTEKALDTALKLFWTHGYEGTSVAHLAAAIGANVPSLYAAFGNKEELFLKAIERYSELHGHIYHESFKKRSAYEVARAILEGEVALVTQRGCPDGCLMIQGALVTSPESDKIRKLMATMRRTAEHWMRDRFIQAQTDGDLPVTADPAGLACYIMTLNSGIAVQAKSGATKKELQQVVDIALRNWPVAGSKKPGTKSRK